MKGFRLQNKDLKKIYFILPVFLFAVFLIVFILNTLFIIWIDTHKVFSSPIILKSDYKYPVIKTEFIPKISATGAIIMDADSKVVLYAKNPDLRFSPASTTKIMTAIVASDYFKPQEILTVKNSTNEGSTIGLFAGQNFTFENLLYAMFLPSANDAALAVSENIPGGTTAFVAQMNKKTKYFDLPHTHYGDPAGLLDTQDYTTPFDLARLSSFALDYPLIKKVVSTKEKVITDVTQTSVYSLTNLNKLLGIDGVNGIKTGFTEEAGQVLVTSKLEKGKTIIIVVMGSEDRFLDTQKLLDLVNNNLIYLSIHP